DRVSILHKTGDRAFMWRAEAPASPVFQSPVAVRVIDDALYFNDQGTGDFFKVDAAAAAGAPIQGTLPQIPTAPGGEPVKFFDFAQIGGCWLINLGTTGTIRRMCDS